MYGFSAASVKSITSGDNPTFSIGIGRKGRYGIFCVNSH
jgi:hypothetical protein